MPIVTPSPSTSLQAVQTAKTIATAPVSKGIGSDFNMFLKLLTTQMQNQDPLSPMDSAQYTQQLVQYSQVEQTVQQSGTLKDILASLSTQTMVQASGFIGREAEFNSAVSGLGAKPASWTFAGSSTMTSGTMAITNAAGTVVDSRDVTLSGSSGSYVWDGTLANGGTAPAGAYTLSLTALNAAGAAIPVTIHSVGIVSEVNALNGMVSLGVNGVPMPMTTLMRLAATQ